MNKKIQKQLDKLVDDYNMMTELVIALHSGRGEWSGNKVGTIYEHFLEDVEVVANENGALEVKNSHDYSCPISDPAIIDIINQLAPKPKAKKAKKPTGKKFRVIYCEHGEDCLGGHRDEWRQLDGVYSTREQAIEALKKDMQTYKNQWEDDIGFVDDGWRVTVSNNLLSASCEWDVVEL